MNISRDKYKKSLIVKQQHPCHLCFYIEDDENFSILYNYALISKLIH